MKKNELRSARLLEMLQLNKQLDVKTVVESFDISEATVRRMFNHLDKEGKVIRTHGGVRLAPHLSTDYSYFLSASHRSREKTLIGRAAAEIITSRDRIFLDSGTTVLKLAEALSLRLQSGQVKNIVVLTTSLVLVEALSRWCKVILVGGETRLERRDVCGPLSEENLRGFRFSRAFFGADAIHIQTGFMTTDEHAAKMDEIARKNSSHSYVLADSEKFNRDSFVRYATLGEIELVLTDPSIPEDVLRSFTEAGAHIRVVPHSAKTGVKVQE
jgi:DeoR family transcriptional regulator, fructose operon transcriptional repressor